MRSVLSPLLASRAANRQAWTFLKKNWDYLSPRVGAMGISRLVEATGALPVEEFERLIQSELARAARTAGRSAN